MKAVGMRVRQYLRYSISFEAAFGVALIMFAPIGAAGERKPESIRVNVDNFARAETDAYHVGDVPKNNDGRTAYLLTLKDVPIDGFWPVSVYNKEATS